MSLYAVKNDKGEWWDFEAYDGFWSDGSCECAVTAYQERADSVIKEHGGHVVELTEEQKVKLPREVGEELEDWLETDSVDTIITDLVCVSEGDPQAVRDWWDSTLDATYLIADMARYGWEAKKEAMYNVKVPLLSNKWFIVNVDGELDSVGNRNFATHFSMTAINGYGLQDCEREEVTDDGE